MTLRRLILLCGLACLNSLPVLAEPEEVYRFERMWPVLQQPWYFDEIWDIAISRQEHVYVVDRRNNLVQKLTLDGHLITQFGTFNEGIRPIEMAVDSKENVYVSYTVTNLLVDSGEETFSEMLSETTASRLEHWSHLIRKFNAHGELISDKWRQSSQCSENLGHIAVDHQDNMYVTCVPKEGQPFVHKLTSDGQWLEKWPVNSDGDIAIDRDHVYILDRNGNRVQKYTLSGEWVMNWKTDEEGETSDFVFYKTKDIAVDSHGNIYVTDNLNRIQQFSSDDGQLLNQWHDEINLGGALQIVFQQLSSMMWQAFKLGLYSSLCPTTDSVPNVPNEANENVETCSQWQMFEALLDYESSFPMTIAVGPQSNVYVGYTMPLSAIKKYTSAGQFITQWTSGGSSTPQLLQMFKDLLQDVIQLADDSGGNAQFQFHQPTDIARDKNGDLYVIDSLAHRVLKFTAEGQLVTQWGELGQGEGQFSSPKGIAIDMDENIYIVDSGNYRIQKLTADGTFVAQWGKLGIGDSDFLAPTYIAVDNNNNVYVVDNLARQIKKFTSEGRFIKAFGDKHLILPWSITVDNNDNIYVTDPENGNIHKFTTDGNFVGEWRTQGSQDGQFENPLYVPLFAPLYVATDEDGNVYVSDLTNRRIQKFRPNGQFMTQWGAFGTNPGQFNRADSLTVSPDGDRVYVVEQTNNRIQVFNRTLYDVGKAIIVAGGKDKNKGNNLWDATQMVSHFAYRTLVYQGFTKDSIYYLNANDKIDLDNNEVADDVDEKPTKEQLKYAITQWAKGTDNLTIYLTDHGGYETFQLNNTEVLTAAELDKWLNTRQSDMTGNIKIIYDACHSGSFLPQLSGPDRMLITSAKAEESAYFLSQGSLSFSSYFWTHIFNGLKIGEAFNQAKTAIGYYLPQYEGEQTTTQTLLLEANGDRSANQPADFEIAQGKAIGNGTPIEGNAPVIVSVSVQKQELANTDESVVITVEVTDDDNIDKVWAMVRSPSEFQPDLTGQTIVGLPSFEFKRLEDNRYQGRYQFDRQDTYEIAVYARDAKMNTSIPKTVRVSVGAGLKRKAIIVVGGPSTNPAYREMAENTRYAYEALKYQGYRDEEIYYLSNVPVPSVDATIKTVDLFNVNDALNRWAQDETRDIVVYLVGIDRENGLVLNETESLRFTELDEALDRLQSTIPGLVTVIYEGQHGGNLLPALKPPSGQQRIVISSRGRMNERCVDNKLLTLSFSNLFWQKILQGADVLTAFVYAQDETGEETAQLDDNGDGGYNLNGNRDGLIAEKYTIGIGIIRASADTPLVSQISSEQFLNGETTATFWADTTVTTPEKVKVWAVITPLNNLCGTVEIPMEPVLSMPGRYQASYDGFLDEDSYKIAIYARDNKRRIYPHNTTYIHQRKPNYLVPSQPVYGDGEQVQVKLPPLPLEDYTHYLAVGLPDGHIFIIKGLNEFMPFDNSVAIPAWQENSGDIAIDMVVNSDISRGEYQFYLVRLPVGTPLTLPPEPQTLAVSTVSVE
ncbi:MAG TPA: hypothetical protein ENF37_04075 [Beggiatoa sp.]|nr:hypothetical protein [Beggiatoa sp.]